MPQAIWNGAVIAESDETVVVERNHYFPKESVNFEYLTDSAKQTTCPWKGVAGYYDVQVGGKTNKAAAWYYPEPSEKAEHIKDHVAFWKGVKIEGAPKKSLFRRS